MVCVSIPHGISNGRRHLLNLDAQSGLRIQPRIFFL
jgi:hypothetical protein